MWTISITKIKCDPRYDHGLKGVCVLDVPIVIPELDTDKVFLYKVLSSGDEFVGVCSVGDLYVWPDEKAEDKAFYRTDDFEVGIRSLSEVDDSADKLWEDLDSLKANILVVKGILASPSVTIAG